MKHFEKLVEPIEVIRAFVRADLIKSEILTTDTDSDLLKKFEAQKLRIDHLDMDQLYDLVPSDKWRLDFYNRHSWVFKSIELKYLAPWYQTGDLPEDWCSMSVVDVASKIKDHPDFDTNSIRRIKYISQHIEIVTKYFPPIACQGGEIRRDPSLQLLPIDSEDGSHRSIAASLLGHTSISGFIGLVKMA